ncbi:UNVERIFIED_CONTAM: hypothetical protein PYX00_006774 [Menopon gallinae]|uniref:Uncharacterized protein n=1 Tax=Menopon gallinae TaxID=328185 RepID=A0AAW2HY69_9NEOP
MGLHNETGKGAFFILRITSKQDYGVSDLGRIGLTGFRDGRRQRHGTRRQQKSTAEVPKQATLALIEK